jgi:hypothetical protein
MLESTLISIVNTNDRSNSTGGEQIAHVTCRSGRCSRVRLRLRPDKVIPMKVHHVQARRPVKDIGAFNAFSGVRLHSH